MAYNIPQLQLQGAKTLHEHSETITAAIAACAVAAGVPSIIAQTSAAGLCRGILFTIDRLARQQVQAQSVEIIDNRE